VTGRVAHARHRQSPRRTAGAVLLGTLLAATGAGGAQGIAEEHEVKAAFLFNFARFVEWPGEAERIELCILGEDPVTRVLGALEGKLVHGRPVHVRRIADPYRLEGCRILYVSRSERTRLAEIVLAFDEAEGVLTVSDLQGFVSAGGMIELVLDGQRVRFDVNVAAASDSGLRISSKLLRLARQVEGAPGATP